MPFTKCPSCKKVFFVNRPTLRDSGFPFLTCPRCSCKHIPKYLLKRAEKEYIPPRKRQILLCGLPAGIIGAMLIILGSLTNSMFVSIFGGLIFSFWILLIAMALSLWKEVIANSKKEYALIQSALKDKKQ